jgi:type IX secretion system PorP/SprF family membrane protein
MKKYVFILTILIAGTGLQASRMRLTPVLLQQTGHQPAYAGSRDAISVLGLYRNQWVGFEGAPKTQSVSIHAPVFTENIGLGLSLIHDEIGISDNMTVNMAYAFRMQFEKGRLALGLNGQIKRQFMDWKSTSPIEQIDGKIPYANTVIWLPNFGLGPILTTICSMQGSASRTSWRTSWNTTGQVNSGNTGTPAKAYLRYGRAYASCI